MKYKVVIPARYASTRLPAKLLIPIKGMSVLERTYRQCLKALPGSDILIATDDERIVEHCRTFGADVVMTPLECKTGTDRIAALLETVDADYFIDAQGDEPLLNPDDLRAIVEEAKKGEYDVINGYCPITEEEHFRSRTIPKVVVREDGTLLYMSRSPIPSTKQDEFISAWRQVCVYAFSRHALERLRERPDKSQLEAIEDIEILRFAEMGIPIKMIPLSDTSIAVDVPADVTRVEEALTIRGE